MNVQEKQAWFILAVMVLTVSIYAALGFTVGFQTWTTGTLGLFGFAGLAPFIGMRERARGKIIYDERDVLIKQRAANAAFGIFWLVFVSGMMAPLFISGPNSNVTIAASDLALAVFAAGVLVFTVHSVAVLIQYRIGRNAG
jgi:uncharacterized membrane protein